MIGSGVVKVSPRRTSHLISLANLDALHFLKFGLVVLFVIEFLDPSLRVSRALGKVGDRTTPSSTLRSQGEVMKQARTRRTGISAVEENRGAASSLLRKMAWKS